MINDTTHELKEMQDKIVRLISALIPEAKIYLYGSRARGTNRPFSDFDLALDAGVPIERSRIFEVKNVLEATSIPYSFDVVDLNDISEELRSAIQKDFVVWKQ